MSRESSTGKTLCSFGTSAEPRQLRKAFEEHGKVLKADVILDRDGRSRGFGFVTMGDPKSAKAAMAALDGAELDGRNLKVSPATDS